MVDVFTEIDIAPEKEIVAVYAASPDNAPEWYVNIKSAEWQAPKPLTVGSKISFKAKFLGKELAYTYEIIEYMLGTKLVMRTAESPFPIETTYTWEATANGETHMTLRNRREPTGFSKLLLRL